VLGYGLIAAGLLVTLRVNLFTLAQIARARTSVPWWDQWEVVEELARRARGEPLWPILWSSYWGHRMVIPRLLFLADARWFWLASLTWLTLFLQFLHVALLIALAWLLLKRGPPAVFMIATAVILNLMLSPFQMQDFVWSMQTMFALVFVAAMGSFLCLSLAGDKRRRLWVALAIALAAIGSLTMPNGLLEWPVLVLEALYLKLGRRVILALALAGIVAAGSYLWNFTSPVMGMGVGGMLRHLVQAILLTGLVVAGPVAFISNAAAAVCGVLTLAVTAYVSARALRLNVPERRWLSALAAAILFLVLSSASVVAGRLDPRYLGRDPLYSVPVRYPTMISALWTCIALLVLYTCWRRQVRPVLLGFYAIPLFYFMFATVPLQFIMAEDWADFFRGADALGSAFLLEAPDEQMLSRLWPNRAEREERAAFLRQRGLAMFHEPRATWMGKNVAELFAPAESGRCIGAIEKTTGLDGFARVQGWAWDLRSGASPDDILLTDATGRIIGLARGGLRHGYIPGLLSEPGPVPLSHARFRHSEWLGYLRRDGGRSPEPLGLYGVLRGQRKVCAIR